MEPTLKIILHLHDGTELTISATDYGGHMARMLSQEAVKSVVIQGTRVRIEDTVNIKLVI